MSMMFPKVKAPVCGSEKLSMNSLDSGLATRNTITAASTSHSASDQSRAGTPQVRRVPAAVSASDAKGVSEVFGDLAHLGEHLRQRRLDRLDLVQRLHALAQCHARADRRGELVGDDLGALLSQQEFHEQLRGVGMRRSLQDRKSTRLNSSH